MWPGQPAGWSLLWGWSGNGCELKTGPLESSTILHIGFLEEFYMLRFGSEHPREENDFFFGLELWTTLKLGSFSVGSHKKTGAKRRLQAQVYWLPRKWHLLARVAHLKREVKETTAVSAPLLTANKSSHYVLHRPFLFILQGQPPKSWYYLHFFWHGKRRFKKDKVAIYYTSSKYKAMLAKFLSSKGIMSLIFFQCCLWDSRINNRPFSCVGREKRAPCPLQAANQELVYHSPSLSCCSPMWSYLSKRQDAIWGHGRVRKE